MNAGKLRHRITIKRPGTSTGTRGELVGEPTVVLKDEPANVVTLNGRELEQARGVYSAASLRVEMRGHRKVPVMRGDQIHFRGRSLHVGFVDDIGQRGIEWHLLCGEVK